MVEAVHKRKQSLSNAACSMPQILSLQVNDKSGGSSAPEETGASATSVLLAQCPKWPGLQVYDANGGSRAEVGKEGLCTPGA
eukprot:scaffold66689_cov17-Tisochrysis_lutea.AAC.1